MLIPIGLLLMIVGGVLFAIKKQPKVATALLGIGTVFVIGAIVVIGLATSAM
jgi:hypothetical protein